MPILELLFNALVVLLFIVAAVLQRRGRRSAPLPDDEPSAEPGPSLRDLMWEPIPMPAPPGAHEEAVHPQALRLTARQSTPPAETGASRPSLWVPSPPHSRPDRQPLFRNKQDLHRAVITMTVLGPCRAQDPYEFSPPRQRP